MSRPADRRAAAAITTLLAQRQPLIPDDAGTVSHVVFNGAGLVDRFGNAWTQNGTVPQVGRSGRTPPGAGPFSDANYYSLGTGNDVLDFAGDWSAATVYAVPASTANIPVLFSNGTFNVDGYFVQVAGTTPFLRFYQNAAAANSLAGDTNALLPAGTLCVAYFGRSGTSNLLKLNLNAAVTAATVATTPATTTSAKIGRYPGATFAFGAPIYELWLSSTAASDAAGTAIAGRVKSRLGSGAW